MKKHLTTAFILSALTASVLAADTPPAKPAAAPGVSPFVQADANKDGKLSAEEFATLQAQQEARFQARQASLPAFEALDTQKRGFVTQEQLREARKARMQAAADADGRGHHRGERHHGEGKGPRGEGKSMFGQADKDDNGQLTKAEYENLLELQKAHHAERQAARPDFKTLDKNQDGFVTHDEMRAAHRDMRPKQ